MDSSPFRPVAESLAGEVEPPLPHAQVALVEMHLTELAEVAEAIRRDLDQLQALRKEAADLALVDLDVHCQHFADHWTELRALLGFDQLDR